MRELSVLASVPGNVEGRAPMLESKLRMPEFLLRLVRLPVFAGLQPVAGAFAGAAIRA